MYTYHATIVRWVDGDTVVCMVDLGFYTHRKERFRLNRINTPEMRGAERSRGKKVKAIVEERYPVGTEIVLSSEKRDKYGRFIAELFYQEENINQWLLDEGHAVEVHY